MKKIEIDVIGELLLNKPFRDQMCSTYIKENIMLSNDIIEHYKLKRIEHKYIIKDRLYDENSYSKAQIRLEESIFILNLSIFEPFVHNIEKQLLIHQTLDFNSKLESTDTDLSIYKLLSLSNEHSPNIDNILNRLVFKSEIYRIDILNNLLNTKKIREKLIEAYCESNKSFLELIIGEYNLKWLYDKYIAKHNLHADTHYARTKLKNEESFLIKKIILFSTWNTYQSEVLSLYDNLKIKIQELGVDILHLNDLYNFISDKYFSMYIKHTLPMNQILHDSVKGN